MSRSMQFAGEWDALYGKHKVTVNDKRYVVTVSSRKTIYPYPDTVVDVYATQVVKDAEYQRIKQQLGDDWDTDVLSSEPEVEAAFLEAVRAVAHPADSRISRRDDISYGAGMGVGAGVNLDWYSAMQQVLAKHKFQYRGMTGPEKDSGWHGAAQLYHHSVGTPSDRSHSDLAYIHAQDGLVVHASQSRGVTQRSDPAGLDSYLEGIYGGGSAGMGTGIGGTPGLPWLTPIPRKQNWYLSIAEANAAGDYITAKVDYYGHPVPQPTRFYRTMGEANAEVASDRANWPDIKYSAYASLVG